MNSIAIKIKCTDTHVYIPMHANTHTYEKKRLYELFYNAYSCMEMKTLVKIVMHENDNKLENRK